MVVATGKVVAAFLAALVLAGSTHGRSDAVPRWLWDAFLCIQRHETGAAWTGGWRANTGNGYYGGLQMDQTFQLYYGRDYVRRYGWAHNWPVAAQIEVAARAWRTRGFGPWPNTRRLCGV